jgi:hypothetical protein
MDQALAVVSEFWRSYDLRVEPDCPPIFVDLFHSNTEYLWRNLVIAKLVQHVTAAPLVGLFGDPGVVASATGGQLSRGNNVRLASAFGVNHFIDVPNEGALGAAERPASLAIADLAASQRDGTPLAPTAIAKLREVRTESGFRWVVSSRKRSCVPNWCRPSWQAVASCTGPSGFWVSLILPNG